VSPNSSSIQAAGAQEGVVPLEEGRKAQVAVDVTLPTSATAIVSSLSSDRSVADRHRRMFFNGCVRLNCDIHGTEQRGVPT
jgi:hypothetical protein